MRTVIFAYPELKQTPIEIIRVALRAAALAPTADIALDLAGAALSRLADLAKSEVTHG